MLPLRPLGFNKLADPVAGVAIGGAAAEGPMDAAVVEVVVEGATLILGMGFDGVVVDEDGFVKPDHPKLVRLGIAASSWIWTGGGTDAAEAGARVPSTCPSLTLLVIPPRPPPGVVDEDDPSRSKKDEDERLPLPPPVGGEDS